MAVSLGGEDPSKQGQEPGHCSPPAPLGTVNSDQHPPGGSGRCEGEGRVAQASLAPSVVDVEESTLTPFSESMAREKYATLEGERSLPVLLFFILIFFYLFGCARS